MTTLVAPPLWTVGPFVLMLIAIAIGPLAVPHWWERNRNKLVVAAVLAAPILMLYLRWRPAAILATAEEYVSFIVLLGGLYVIALLRLACPSIVVASDDDIYTSLNRAEAFARAWGSRFVRLLRAGHINSASGHGDWPEGRAWLEELVRGAPGGR